MRQLKLADRQELHLEQQILGNNLQQALPAALQQAGINLALVQQYIPTVIAALVPLLAQRIVASRRQAGITMFVAEGTALAAQIMGNDPNGFTSAARPVPEPLRTAMNPVAPQQFAPAPPAHFVPQVPQAQPAMQPPIAPPNITQQPPAPVFAGDPPTLLE